MSDYNPQKLREIRTRLNLKQDQMALKAGLSQRDISLLENGKKEFIPTRYMRFLNRAGINLNWIFSDEEEGEEPSMAQDPDFALEIQTIRQGNFDKNTENITSKRVPVVQRNQLATYAQLREEKGFVASLPHILLPPDDLPEVATRCFQLDDDSMAETLLPFDYLVAQHIVPWEGRLRPGFLYVWVTAHDVLVRRLVGESADTLTLRGDHEAYPEITILKSGLAEVWQVKARLSFQLPAHPHIWQEQLGSIRASLEKINQNLSGN